MADEPEDTYSSKGPICPYCKHEHNPNDEPSYFYSETQDVLECNRCGKASKMEVIVTHSWSCEPIEE